MEVAFITNFRKHYSPNIEVHDPDTFIIIKYLKKLPDVKPSFNGHWTMYSSIAKISQRW